MWELFNLYRADFQHGAGILLGMAMLRWGGGPERWAAVVFLSTIILPTAASTRLLGAAMIFGSYSWIYVLLDLIAGAAFLLIALYANRNYTLWIAGFQLVAIGAHAARGLVDAISPLAYAILAVGPSYCQLALLLAGFLRHLARRRRYGDYRDWRVAAAPSRPVPFPGRGA